MKTAVILFLLIIFPVAGFAQETGQELAKDFDSIIGFLLPAIIGQLAVLFADAKKYMGSGIWDWNIFWTTKIIPFLITTGGAIVIYLLLAFLPFARPFLEVLTGPIGAVTAFSLFAAAQALVDGLMKPTVDPTTPDDVNMKHNAALRREI